MSGTLLESCEQGEEEGRRGSEFEGAEHVGLVGLHKGLGLILNKKEGRFQQGNNMIHIAFNKITDCCVENGLQVGKNRSKETTWEAISMIQVRDDGGLHQHGGSQRQGGRSRGSGCILYKVRRWSQEDLLTDWIRDVREREESSFLPWTNRAAIN